MESGIKIVVYTKPDCPACDRFMLAFPEAKKIESAIVDTYPTIIVSMRGRAETFVGYSPAIKEKIKNFVAQ